MFLTQAALIDTMRVLDAARGTFDCPASRKDANGNQTFGEKVAYGTHGAAFLQIDPETNTVRCGACAGEMDATARTKQAVANQRTGRTQLLTTP